MSDVTYSWDGIDDIADDFDDMARRADNPRPAHDEMHRVFMRQRDVDFKSRGATTRGGRWAPLAPATRRSKRRPGRILRETGRLHASLTQASHPDHIYRSDPTGVEMGTRVPYATFHQTGTKRMPARPPVDPADDEIDIYVLALLAHLAGGLEDGAGPTASVGVTGRGS